MYNLDYFLTKERVFMSLISGLFLFSLPAYSVYQAYAATRNELPVMTGNSEIIHKNDPRYELGLLSLPGRHLKPWMQGFLDKSEIRKDLIMAEIPNFGICCAIGTNMFTKGDAAILVAPEFYETDREACSWTVKHEISHIKHNDHFSMSCLPSVCQLGASIFGMYFLPFVPTLGLVFSVGLVSGALFSQWREAKADDFAIENSSDEELKGGRRILIAARGVNIIERTTLLKQILISTAGENRLDITHPSITSRIQKIERALQERHCEIQEEEEMPKINRLKSFIICQNFFMEIVMKGNNTTPAERRLDEQRLAVLQQFYRIANKPDF